MKVKNTTKKALKKPESKGQKKIVDLTGTAKSCKFIGIVRKSPIDSEEITISYKFDKPETDLTYDEVEDKLFLEMQEICPEDCYPKAFIQKIFIEDHKVKNKLYPVFPKDSKESEDKELQKKYEAILVLPWATYTLTPEARLYYALIEEGIVSKDSFDFNYEKMKRILEKIEKLDHEANSSICQ